MEKNVIEFLSHTIHKWINDEHKSYLWGIFLNLSEENIRCYLSSFKIGMYFLDKTLKIINMKD